MPKTLVWFAGANGNLFADGPRPLGTPSRVRYCIAFPHPRFGSGLFELMWNGNPIANFGSVDAAKAWAESEATGHPAPHATGHNLY